MNWFIRNIKNGWLLEVGAVALGLTGAYLNRKSEESRTGVTRRFLPQ